MFRYCVTLPAILISLLVVFLVMILVFEFQRWVDGMDNPPKWLKFAPKIALAVSIGKMDDIYKTIAYKLNDKGKMLYSGVKHWVNELHKHYVECYTCLG